MINPCTCPGLEAVGISPEEQKDVLCAVCNPDLTCEVCGETGHVYCHEECEKNEDILVILRRELEQRREPVLVDILQRAITEITDLREDLERINEK